MKRILVVLGALAALIFAMTGLAAPPPSMGSGKSVTCPVTDQLGHATTAPAPEPMIAKTKEETPASVARDIALHISIAYMVHDTASGGARPAESAFLIGAKTAGQGPVDYAIPNSGGAGTAKAQSGDG